MTFNSPRDRRLNPNDPTRVGPPSRYGGWIPILLALAVVAAVIAMMYPRTATERVGDTTNTGPSMQTVTPAPSPSTSAVVPTPNPTTEPRPTQAPQP